MNNRDNSFWPSYVDIMTTLFAIMLILFAVSFHRYKEVNGNLEKVVGELKITEEKYKMLQSIYSVVENIDTNYFEFNSKYVKHIFKLKVAFQTGEFNLNGGLVYDKIDSTLANELRNEILCAGNEIKKTIEFLQKNDTIKQDIKYLVVIEGQASSDGYNKDNWHNNNVLSYQRAYSLNEFWCANGIDFSQMEKCELVISGSGEKGVPRDETDERNNQRFLVHIVPVIGNINIP